MNKMNKISFPIWLYQTRIIAKHFDVTEATVCNWRKTGEIPHRYAQAAIDLLRGNFYEDDRQEDL